MASPPELTFTTTADGRVFASVRHADGSTAVEFPVPGELGTLLRESGYAARLVVTRIDQGALTENDRAFVGDAMTAAAEHGTHSPRVREQVAAGHFTRARARLAKKNALKKTG
jgi:hypothetical protein